ncbi:MAG: hypothetical protein U5S82_10105 [Gammaproteobacteria bacterium]|nr:hypothetical protein [Gammaproteobacteria bacterium]
MNEPPKQQESDIDRRLVNLSEEELDEALSTLEHILRHRHVVPDDHPHAAAAADHDEALPILKDVVIPGDPPTPLAMDTGPDGAFEVHDSYDESLEPAPHHDDLVVRLVNELEIIIESCVDDALAAAKRNLMVKMKNHLDIVLPEILDELEHRRFETDDDDQAAD